MLAGTLSNCTLTGAQTLFHSADVYRHIHACTCVSVHMFSRSKQHPTFCMSWWHCRVQLSLSYGTTSLANTWPSLPHLQQNGMVTTDISHLLRLTLSLLNPSPLGLPYDCLPPHPRLEPIIAGNYRILYCRSKNEKPHTALLLGTNTAKLWGSHRIALLCSCDSIYNKHVCR